MRTQPRNHYLALAERDIEYGRLLVAHACGLPFRLAGCEAIPPGLDRAERDRRFAAAWDALQAGADATGD
jgi:hypothetical protein